MKKSYAPEEVEALNTAIEAANATLDKLWTGKGPRYYVTFIELGRQESVRDPRYGERLLTNQSYYLMSEGRKRP